MAGHITLSAIGTLLVLVTTDNIISQDACLGRYEYHYDKPAGTQTCTKGGIVLRILCWLTIMGHMIISYNIPETYMLYLCFKAIKAQTEKSRESIGQENYNRRKR